MAVRFSPNLQDPFDCCIIEPGFPKWPYIPCLGVTQRILPIFCILAHLGPIAILNPEEWGRMAVPHVGQLERHPESWLSASSSSGKF